VNLVHFRLTDTGPLVSLINANDPHHGRCQAQVRQFGPHPLLTTWPCFTEAMYLVGKAGGFPAQQMLWQWRAAGRLLLHDAGPAEADRMAGLMTQYRDTPMDLADASLVAAAETLLAGRVFTLDHHFYAYRRADGAAFEVVP